MVVLNSCTVTAAADAKARQYLRAARRRNPGAVVVATGCYAQRAPADIEALPEVSLVIGNTGKASLVESTHAALNKSLSESCKSSPADPVILSGVKSPARTRAMVKIQEGLRPSLRLLHSPQGARPRTQHPAGNDHRRN